MKPVGVVLCAAQYGLERTDGRMARQGLEDLAVLVIEQRAFEEYEVVVAPSRRIVWNVLQAHGGRVSEDNSHDM